ncbi:hypothetical protein D3C72_1884190 [compost metagenome]
MPYSSPCVRRASGKVMRSTSSMSPPNTLPWPQPVVTTLLAVRSSMRAMPWRVRTAAALTSQSTVMDSMSNTDSTSRWLRK